MSYLIHKIIHLLKYLLPFQIVLLDGFYQPMSNKHVFVYVENKYKQLIPCEFYGLISSDQAVIKIPDDEFNKLKEDILNTK